MGENWIRGMGGRVGLKQGVGGDTSFSGTGGKVVFVQTEGVETEKDCGSMELTLNHLLRCGEVWNGYKGF